MAATTKVFIANVPVDLVRPSGTELRLGENGPNFGGLRRQLMVGAISWTGVAPSTKRNPLSDEGDPSCDAASVKPVLILEVGAAPRRAIAWLRGGAAGDSLVMDGATLSDETGKIIIAEEPGKQMDFVTARGHIQEFLNYPEVQSSLKAAFEELESRPAPKNPASFTAPRISL